MSQDHIQEIELNIAEAKKFVALGKSVEKLMANRDFKKVISEGYLEQEAIRLVHLKADPNMQDAESQAAIVTQIDAIGSFTAYLNKVMGQARMAEQAIEADEQELDLIRGEEGEA